MRTEMLHPKFITDHKGRKMEVILPIEEYQELLEDLEDLSIIAARKDEETIPFDEVIDKLNLKTHV